MKNIRKGKSDFTPWDIQTPKGVYLVTLYVFETVLHLEKAINLELRSCHRQIRQGEKSGKDRPFLFRFALP
jgi:hypothetical protein